MHETMLLINPRGRESAAERGKLRRAAKRAPRNTMGQFIKAKRNPRKKTARTHHKAAHEYMRKNPRRSTRSIERVRAYTRRNPKGLFDGLVNKMLVPSMSATGGAILTELAAGYLPLPTSMQTGVAGFATKALIAVGLGMLGRAVGLKDSADMIAIGGLTVATYNEVKDLAAVHMPTLKLGSVGYFSAGYVTQPGQLGVFDSSTMPMPSPVVTQIRR